MESDDLAETHPNRFCDGNEFFRFGGWQVRAAVARPQTEPRLKMPLLEPEWNMFHGHRPAVACGSTDRAGPKVRDFFEMRGPVGNVGREDGRDFVVLAHIGIKIFQEMLQLWPSADAVE